MTTAAPRDLLRKVRADCAARWITRWRGTLKGWAELPLEALLSINVHGVGIGFKQVGGRLTAQPCVRLFVLRKLPAAQLPPDALLPAEIGGVAIDVVQRAPQREHAGKVPSASSARRRRRPLRPGLRVRREMFESGTLGALCLSTRPGEGNRHYLLSNSHVLAQRGLAPPGTPILQPGKDGAMPAPHRVARLARSVLNARLDAAIAELDAGVSFVPDVLGIGRVGDVLAPADPEDLLGRRASKFGSSTGLTRGVVTDVAFDTVIERSDGEIVQAFDQIRIEQPAGAAMSAPGDSGALVVDDQTRAAIALLRGGGSDAADFGHCFAIPIAAVLAALEIRLL